MYFTYLLPSYCEELITLKSLKYTCYCLSFQRVWLQHILIGSIMSEVRELTEQETQEWIRGQYLKATKYLADKGIVTNSVSTEQCRYFIPIVSVWKLTTLENKTMWVISGEVPCDHIDASAAVDAREALRNFSMKWQLQSENILASGTREQTQIEFAQLLVKRAEGLYHLFNNDKLWLEQP